MLHLFFILLITGVSVIDIATDKTKLSKENIYTSILVSIMWILYLTIQ